MIKNLFKSRFSSQSALSSKTVTMFSLGKERSLLRVLRKYAWRIISIATGRTKVAPRLRRFDKFMMLVLKYYKHHGASSTIKWMKACHLAVQRKLSSKPCQSLREIDPSLPLPRLINGLPTFIGTMDRRAISNNCPSTIRLWLSILSIYRVLKGPLNPKLNTITDPFLGSVTEIKRLTSEFSDVLTSNSLLVKGLPSLSAHSIVKSLSAGPNNPVAILSVLTDAIALAKYPEVYEPFRKYSLLTKSSILSHLDEIIEWLFQVLTNYGNGWVRISKSISFDDIALGKLSFKEEAAGKLRIFAIADIWTQSLLEPLHKALFTLLRRLPNDGTFDQDASYQRCLDKAVLYNCAYSVDLSSATDRLPISLQSNLIDLLFGIEGLGEAWKSILVERPYMIRKNSYKIPIGHVYYATGQPMGALSSWAMLAATHHFILQVSAKRAYPNSEGWYSRYEILGDDLVIFDTKVYQEYLTIMNLLDVGTNPSKSLYSDSLDALEYAKRTGVKGIDVSGLSWKQFISDPSMQGRINQLIYFANKGLVTTLPMILTILGRTKGDNSILCLSRKDSRTRQLMEQSLMALLGHFVNSNKMTLIDAVAFTIDPHDEELENLDKPSLPIIATLHEALRLLNLKVSSPVPFASDQLSEFSERKQIAKSEVVGFMADSIMRDSLSRAQLLCNNYDLLLDGYAAQLVDCGVLVLREENSPFGIRKRHQPVLVPFNEIELAQLRSFAEFILLCDRDPEDLKDHILNFALSVRDLPTMDQALQLSTLIDDFESSLKYSSNSRAMMKSPVGWLHKDIIHAGQLKVTPYWKLVA